MTKSQISKDFHVIVINHHCLLSPYHYKFSRLWIASFNPSYEKIEAQEIKWQTQSHTIQYL
jgi:hypothetical protein